MFIHRFILNVYERLFEIPDHLKSFDTYLNNIILELKSRSCSVQYEISCNGTIKIRFANETISIYQYGWDEDEYKVSTNKSDYVKVEKFHRILRKKIKTIYKICHKLSKEKETYKEISAIIIPFKNI